MSEKRDKKSTDNQEVPPNSASQPLTEEETSKVSGGMVATCGNCGKPLYECTCNKDLS